MTGMRIGIVLCAVPATSCVAHRRQTLASAAPKSVARLAVVAVCQDLQERLQRGQVAV